MNKAIVFDLDGTLVDSAPDLMDAHNYVMQKFGYNQKPLTNIRHLAGRGAANMILSSLKEEDKKFDQNIHKKMTEEFINYYRENISKKSRIIKGVNEFLAWGKSQEIIFAICTNKMESLAKKLLKEINLIEFFDYIAGADTFECRKPDPRHLTNILEILDVKKEDSIMVGDSETDAETARIAKVNFILVKGGYTEKDQNSIYHDHFINDFTEMNGILSKMRFLN
jgi:phosphoglycolate phosphatase